jgi:thioesterase domain-containing protein
VYGLSIQLLDQHPHIENRIEDWARFYILQVKQIQPSGPYMFIGFSNGGIIAFEMAKQMRESGEDVRLVAILDAILPKTFKKIGVVRKVKEQYKKWKRQGAYYFVRQVVQRLYYVGLAEQTVGLKISKSPFHTN